MKKKKDLFDLIRSMTKSEKRYFKLFSSLHTIGSKNNYVTLFDAIEKQKEYDEEVIVKLFSKEQFVKRLPVAKDYLYRLIMKALHSYHSNTSVNSIIKEQLHCIEILYKKKLYDQCQRNLSGIKILAKKYEQHLHHYEIIMWESKLMSAAAFANKTEKDIERFYGEGKNILKKLENIIEYMNLSFKLHINLSKGGVFARNSREFEKIKSIRDEPLLRFEKNALSDAARIWYYNFNLTYFFYTGDYTNAYTYAKKEFGLVESNLDAVEQETKRYITSLYNLLTICLKLKKENEINIHLKQLRTISERFNIKNKQDTLVYSFVFSYRVESRMYIISGQFNKGILIIPEIENGLEQYKGKLNKPAELEFYMNISLLYFGSEKYRKALLWINKILNESKTDVRQDIFIYARIINLIIHFELGNEELLERIVKSTYYFLHKRNKLYQFETIILNFIRKELQKIKTKEELIEAFKKLKSQIVKISKDPYEEKVLQYFDFISWLESKIENRPFASIVKEKWEKNT